MNGIFSDSLDERQTTLIASNPPAPLYTHQTTHKIFLLANQLFFALGYALVLYQGLRYFDLVPIYPIPLAAKIIFISYLALEFLHMIAGKLIIPASLNSPTSEEEREEIPIETMDAEGWKLKRFSIKVDEYTLDAIMIGHESSLENKRWTLITGGNGERYEYLSYDVYHDPLKKFLSALKSNAIWFNYPGVGTNAGFPDRAITVKAYKAFLTYLEEEMKAKEIIGYGHSIGGAVQAAGFENHKLKDDVKYLCIKSRTFSTLSDTAANMLFRPINYLIKIALWEFDTVKASKNLKCKEIIVQTHNQSDYGDLKLENIIHDGIIDSSVSLAAKLLEEKPSDDKFFMGIPEKHNEPFFRDPKPLARKISEVLG